MSIYYIYALVDPETKRIHYVGMSITPQQRFHQHICHARVEGSRMAASEWIAGLLRDGSKPEMIILEEYETNSRSEAMDVERQWIAYHHSHGGPLVNRMWRAPYRRRSRILPGREPTLCFDNVRGWYYVHD